MKSISISEKLIVYFVFLGIGVIIIVGSISYHFAKKALSDRTFNQLISLRLEKKNRIEQFFMDRNRDIQILCKSEEVKKIIGVLKEGDSSLGNYGYSFLSRYVSGYGYFQRLLIVDRGFHVFEIHEPNPGFYADTACKTTSPDSLKSFCLQIEHSTKTTIRDLTPSDLLIYVGSTVLDETGSVMGFVVLEIPISAINKIMFGHSEAGGLGKTGETYLVGSDYLMRSNSRFAANAVLAVKVTSESVKNAFEGITGCDIVKDYRNISCISSYSKVDIEGLDWVIMAEIDEQEAMIPVYSIRNSILLVSVIIAASVFVFAFLISRRITQPLKRLQKASEQVGAGNYDVNVAVISQDETGMLTEAFNVMSTKLKKQSREIEEEKTKRMSSMIDGQEMERQRLSRDLHDGLGQSLLAVKIKLEQAKGADPVKSQHIIVETQELLKSSINEIRNITNDLMPPVLEAFGLAKGLQNLCKNTAANTGIDIDFFSENISGSLDSRIQIYLYRIAQEAINNITKHSLASQVVVRLGYDHESVSLTIEDNGKGFEVDKPIETGNGIININERVGLLKGECKIYSSGATGTRIQIKIPITQNDEN